jgi:hypothetical protein
MLLDAVRSRAGRRPLPLPEADTSRLDEPLRAVWRAVRHLFPAHAMVDQTDHGCMLVSWHLHDERRRAPEGAHFASPVIMRLRPGLLLALWTCDPALREAIAREQEPIVREQMAGYDARSRVPTCGVIVLGD